MKFLSKLDPMTVLMLVVIFGVVITMAAQASTQATTQATTQVVSEAMPGNQGDLVSGQPADASFSHVAMQRVSLNVER